MGENFIDPTALSREEASANISDKEAKSTVNKNNELCDIDVSGIYKSDIGGASRWQKLNPFVLPELDNQQISSAQIRNRYQYIPDYINSEEKAIVFVIIHGSLAGRNTKSYYDQYDKDNQNFRHIMRFAAQYAIQHKQVLDLLSFQWNGIPEQSTLKAAARKLTYYLEMFYNDSTIVILAHSHGCTIANLVTQSISRSVQLLIYFACPVMEPEGSFRKQGLQKLAYNFTNDVIKTYGIGSYKFLINCSYNLADTMNDASPDKFHELVYFYSTKDMVVPVAALNKYTVVSGGVNYFLIKKCRTFMQQKISGINPSRSIINKFIYEYGETVLNYTVYPAHGENYIEGLMRFVNTAINSYTFKLQTGKTIVGVHTKINGEYAGHSDIIDSASFLTEIFYIFEKNYPIYFSGSSTFDLYAYTEAQEMYLTLREARIQPNCNLSPQGKKRVRGRSYSQTDKEDSYNNKQMQSCKHKRKDDLMNSNSDVIKRKKGCIIQ